MLIDWFTVGAQALNFVILLWLLRRFLYKPILHAIDAREAGVAARLAEAETKRTEAGAELADYQGKNQELDAQRATLLREATDGAGVERRRLLDEAREEATAASAKRHAALMSEARDFNDALLHRTRQEVFAIARRALSDLTSTSLEEHFAEGFVRRLRALEGEPRAQLAQALATASGPAVVRSAFELPPEPRAAIQAALDETFSQEVPTRFEVAPDLLGGIELTAHGQKVTWSIEGYLASMEGAVGELVARHATVQASKDGAVVSGSKTDEHAA